MKYEVVSVDMFGTLAGVDSVAASVWKTFLKDGFSAESGEKYWNRATELLFQHYDRAVQQSRYVPLKVLYEQFYTDLFIEIGLDYSPKDAARTLANYQSQSALFGDTEPFLNSVGKEYRICLSSDTDEDMLGRLRHLYPFDKVFTSEELGSFKTGLNGKFFSDVIAHYGVQPERIFHIGDSRADIIGANKAGIVNCWLNRNGRTWAHDIKPDYEVKSLTEAASILGINPKSVKNRK